MKPQRKDLEDMLFDMLLQAIEKDRAQLIAELVSQYDTGMRGVDVRSGDTIQIKTNITFHLNLTI